MTLIAGPMEREFLNIAFSTRSAADVVGLLERSPADAPYRYIVTPNVDHLVRLESERSRGDPRGLMAIFDDAALRLCDSRVLARLAALNGISLPVVTGSDLTKRVFDTIVSQGDIIAVIGGEEPAIADLRTRYPTIDIVHHNPPMGLLENPTAMDAAADFAAKSGARFIFLAVGFPQQELLAAAIARRDSARGCALCIGASIDFIVGRQRRAPYWVQRLGLEWSFRLLQNPQRMWRRYLVEGPRIFPAVWRWRRRRARSNALGVPD